MCPQSQVPAHLVGASIDAYGISRFGQFSCLQIRRFAGGSVSASCPALHCMLEGAKLQGQGWQKNCHTFPAKIGKHGQNEGVRWSPAYRRSPFGGGQAAGQFGIGSISGGERRSSQVVSFNAATIFKALLRCSPSRVGVWLRPHPPNLCSPKSPASSSHKMTFFRGGIERRAPH